MEFEEFLKEKNLGGGLSHVIRIKDLGEWAWDFVLEDLKSVSMVRQAMKEGWEFNFYNVNLFYTQDLAGTALGVRWEEVVACLGEKEVEKRLKEMKKE